VGICIFSYFSGNKIAFEMNFLLVFLGGGLGSLARYGLSLALANYAKSNHFPLATFLANFFACLVLFLSFYVFKEKIGNDPQLMAFIAIGFCGGFSTFSTFARENVELFQTGNWSIALLNILVSFVFCFGVFFLKR
jgi:CrcB protein